MGQPSRREQEDFPALIEFSVKANTLLHRVPGVPPLTIVRPRQDSGDDVLSGGSKPGPDLRHRVLHVGAIQGGDLYDLAVIAGHGLYSRSLSLRRFIPSEISFIISGV